MENDEFCIPISMFSQISDIRMARLYNDIQSETLGFFKKPFTQELTAELCEVLLRAQHKAEAENVNFSIHNPFRVTLNGGDVYEIYFKDYEYVEDKKVQTIPQGAVYKIYDYGQERVW